MSGEQHIKASARLRGQGKYVEALAEIENNLASFDDITIVPALLQALYAAEATGDASKAQDIASELQKHDPDIPSVKKYLP
jgi:hypothetical protein